MTPPPRILAIAGSDSSGGAGIQADIKTITMLGGYAMTAITAVTAQNTVGVQAVEVLPVELVVAQIESCLSDIGVDAIKIGMLGSAAIAHAVADLLEPLDIPPVFDPVMIATNGAELADEETIEAFERLMALSFLTTPNHPELERLGGQDDARWKTANLLVTGGHAEGPEIENLLLTPTGEWSFWVRRVETLHTHGTGCTLSAAIATGIGAGLALEVAVDRAIRFIEKALIHAPGFGAGHGPMGHALGRVPFYDALAAIDTQGFDARAHAAKWGQEYS
jgi:hydroxymethylpyrimidine/phosphomethylpyrimidine kinase